jgi:hypothetical protein
VDSGSYNGLHSFQLEFAVSRSVRNSAVLIQKRLVDSRLYPTRRPTPGGSAAGRPGGWYQSGPCSAVLIHSKAEPNLQT